MEYIHHYNSPLGEMIETSDGENLTGLWFKGQRYTFSKPDAAHEEKNLPVFQQTDKWLDIYFSGKSPDFVPPIHLNTTEFRKSVCEIMQKIPYGCTMTYGEIAKIIAMKKGAARMSAQAVGGAVGHNPISIIIPCHRVVGTDGSLTGYGGGMDRKVRLLTLERVDMSSLFVPKQ